MIKKKLKTSKSRDNKIAIDFGSARLGGWP